MLPLFVVTCASAAPAWSGAHVAGEDEAPRRAAVAVGVGGSWIVGDNAAGYDAGAAERLVVDIATGHTTAFTVELDHARHALADAGAYFPDTPLPADAITGFRDYVVVDAGFRLALDVRGPDADPDRVTALPYLRVGLGLALTNTLLDAPGFAGRVAMRSRTAWPAPGFTAGAEIRIRRWISLFPQIKTQFQVFEDGAESTGGHTRVGAEWRIQPALDASINF
jgi:hypothetical protein